MTYSTSNPPIPALVVPYTDGTSDLTFTLWLYIDADAKGTLSGTANYFTNGSDLGMKANDLVILIDTATPLISLHRIEESSSDGASPSVGVDIGNTT